MTTVHCPACDRESAVVYRCEYCGKDLADKGTTSGREAVER